MPLNVNLKPQDSEEHKNSLLEQSYNYIKYLLVLFNIILFVAYVYKLNLIKKNTLLKEEVNKIQVKIESLQKPTQEYDDIQKITNLVKKAQEKDVDPIFILKFLKTGTPDGITIKDMSVSGGNLSITAESESPEIFSSFVASMINEKRFQTVILVSSVKTEKEKSYLTKFKLTYK